MNILLLEADQMTGSDTALLSDRQSEHIDKVLKGQIGDRVKVGILNGNTGTAHLYQKQNKNWQLKDITLQHPPSPPLPITLILAMPRPQMLKRILQTVSCMGVEKLILIQTGKVEKSFWQSPSATDQAIRHQLILGLEQGVATQLPGVEKHQRFRPFIEDYLPSMTDHCQRVIAHPSDTAELEQVDTKKPTILAIGPEGGFTAHEVEQFISNGFAPCSLGARILKVEIAVPTIIAKLFL